MQVSLQPLRQGACRATLAAVCVFCLSGFALAQVSASLKPLPPDPAAERFIADLIGKMTLEEKVAQMSQVPLNQPSAVPPEELARRGLGSFLFITDAKRIDQLQHIAVERSRLHIPLLFGFDVIHGFRTVYPVPLALAASWDPATAEKAQAMAAREARSQGIQWTFAPMVDIARDPRWGRILEGAGEDPYLGSRMAEAQVHGFQGASLADKTSILACVKHFAGYGGAVGGRDYEESNLSDEQLWNVYFPPFHAALAAGAGSLMSAYMDLNGVPATGNKFLLHDVLRDQWHFQGFVVSDWEVGPQPDHPRLFRRRCRCGSQGRQRRGRYGDDLDHLHGQSCRRPQAGYRAAGHRRPGRARHPACKVPPRPLPTPLHGPRSRPLAARHAGAARRQPAGRNPGRCPSSQ